MATAFAFYRKIGRDRMLPRHTNWNTQFKEELAKMPGVKVYTPRPTKLSAGLICFDMGGLRPAEMVERMLQRRNVITQTPYGPSFARIAPNILLRPEEAERTLRELRALAS